MEIGIIGSGNIGSTLAGYLTTLGHRVLIANSRGPETLDKIATQTGAKAATAPQAAGVRDLIIIAIPNNAIVNLPVAELSGSNAIIIDAGNYYPSRDGQLKDFNEGMTDSQWVEKVIGHPVVKAFNNIVAQSLSSKALPFGSPDRVCLSVAGDDRGEKNQVIRLIDEIGFDAIDGGLLADSWRQQPGAPAYCQDLDREALNAALLAADKSKQQENLAKADEMARPYF